MVEKLIAAALVVSAVAAGVGAGGAAATTTEAPQRADGQMPDADPAVVGNYTAERVNDTTFRFEYRFEVSQEVENLTFEIGPVENATIETEGFTRNATTNSTAKFDWSGEDHTPVVAVEFDVREWSSGLGNGVVTEDWASVIPPLSSVAWDLGSVGSGRDYQFSEVPDLDGWELHARNGT